MKRFLQTLWLFALLPVAAFAWDKDKPATPPVIPPNPGNLPKVLLIQSNDDVHFSGAGSGLMAKQVAESVLKALGSEAKTGGS